MRDSCEVLQLDFERYKRDILLDQFAFMREHPSTPFSTVFDYNATGRVRLKITSMTP